jgi:hypothetical protein
LVDVEDDARARLVDVRLVRGCQDHCIGTGSSAPESPEEVRVLLGVDGAEFTVGCEDRELKNVVGTPA